MEFYLALILALALACAAGVLYFYLLFLEARGRQMQKRIAELEKINVGLLEDLRKAEVLVRQEAKRSQDLWPEMIDEGGGYSIS
ncbi:MAG TPA: hypothetical protein VM934_06310 [Pyrinomonadaceae bacterium]|nr:hypothetical protein [Pyrinomonadaceae bacterium]